MKDNRRDEKKKRRTEADLQRYSMLSKNGHTKGAPPFVAEILSPSTRSRDLLLKNYIYGNAGVREYWCIDPDQQREMQHRFYGDRSAPEPDFRISANPLYMNAG